MVSYSSSSRHNDLRPDSSHSNNSLNGSTRRPILHYPTLHLGSFRGLDSISFPSSSLSLSPDISEAPKRSGVSPSDRSFDTSHALKPVKPTRRDTTGSASSLSTTSSNTRIMALPPLPSISPISPFSPTSPAEIVTASKMDFSALPLPPSLPPTSVDERSTRPITHSLSIHIPRSLTPSTLSQSPDDYTMRESPSIARRRTVVQASPITSRIASGRATQVANTDDSAPDPTELNPSRTVQPGSLIMPIPRPSPATEHEPQLEDPPEPSTPHRLEKKQGSLDLRNTSPTFPTPKRSLPRPPSQRPLKPELALSIGDLPRPPSLPSPIQSTAQPVRTSSQYPAPDPVPPPARHVPSKSASSIPVIGGLSDAGPYPSANPIPNAGPSGIGIGRPGQAKPRRPVQEEVCIECMMRDRDLADVIVSGDGVWERKSDVAWEDLKAREEEILRSAGSEHSNEIPSLDYSDGSDDDSASMPSTNHSGIDDLEARRRAAERIGRKEQRRARRRQIDWKILHEVGWRGFKWEEGGGEGLPKGFRGGRGGALSEDAIKAVMRKFPSASAHRAKYMDNYLYHQAILIREIRAEALRIGHYPLPDEPTERRSIIAGPRTSSVAWGQNPARDFNEQSRSAFDKPASASPTLRQSPSTPIDLVARYPVQTPSRPATHFYPDREGPTSQRSPAPLRADRKSMGSTKTMDKSAVWADDEPWPPISPVESGLRPFSFAVRAGATGKGSSDGHGRARKSILGRWGGSVTSFFGGSQGGSGSMMDMHLGLDQDRGHSSNFVETQPRAVSLASPTRPSFFGKDSRTSSYDQPREKEPRLNKSISSSRLSQVLAQDPAQECEPKKKGLKGLLNKIKHKGHKKESSRSSRPDQSPEAPLAPPPNMARLARDRSSSTSSNHTDASGLPTQPGTAYLPYNHRSVSAPQAASSSGSQSASPTSARYRRESYASEVDGDKRAGMETLAGRARGLSINDPSVVRGPVQANHFRGNKTTSSFSNSSLLMPSVETPPPGVNGANAFFAQQAAHQQADFGQAQSSNRYKTLPPLPRQDTSMSASPDSFHAIFPDAAQMDYSRLGGYNQQVSNSPRGYAPRASYDPLGDRGRHREPSPRLAQSMYVQPGAMDSAGSFGGDPWPPRRDAEGRSVKGKKGLKSFFGVAKAGRVA